MSNILQWISDNWVNLLAAWGGLCVVVDFVVGLSATTKDDAIWTKIKNAVQSVINLNPFTKKK